MTKCVKRMITCTPKTNIIILPSTKKIEKKKKGMEMAKCVNQMITCTRKINILVKAETFMLYLFRLIVCLVL